MNDEETITITTTKNAAIALGASVIAAYIFTPYALDDPGTARALRDLQRALGVPEEDVDAVVTTIKQGAVLQATQLATALDQAARKQKTEDERSRGVAELLKRR